MEHADESDGTDWYDRKSRMMETALGPEHDRVMHAIIPFYVGGGLDLYYYPHGVPGTAIATKELSESQDAGSSNDAFRTYELVMFTRQPLDLDSALDESTPFGRVHARINAILNPIARYSEQAKLNPNETCEFPDDMEGVGGRCLVFDAIDCGADGFGLLVVLEVFRSEMQFARAHGGAALLDRLREAGHHPYSDLDREPVA